MALFDWGLTPEYINQFWTEEKLQLMFESRTKRILRTFPAKPEERTGARRLSNAEFFARHRSHVKEMKRA